MCIEYLKHLQTAFFEATNALSCCADLADILSATATHRTLSMTLGFAYKWINVVKV